jgi:hypothetical protein
VRRALDASAGDLAAPARRRAAGVGDVEEALPVAPALAHTRRMPSMRAQRANADTTLAPRNDGTAPVDLYGVSVYGAGAGTETPRGLLPRASATRVAEGPRSPRREEGAGPFFLALDGCAVRPLPLVARKAELVHPRGPDRLRVRGPRRSRRRAAPRRRAPASPRGRGGETRRLAVRC